MLEKKIVFNSSHRQKFNDIANNINQNLKNNINFYKNRLLVGLTLILVCIFFLTGFTAFCETKSYENAEGITKFAIDMVDDIFGGNSLDTIKNILRVEYAANSSFTINGSTSLAIGSALNTIYGIFKAIGLYLLFLYFGIGLWEELTFNQIMIEKAFKKVIYFIIATVCVAKSQEIVYAIANMGTYLVDKTFTAISEGSNSVAFETLKQNIYSDCSKAENEDKTIDKFMASIGDIGSAIGYILQLFIPWIVSKVASVIVQFVCWSRFFEIILMGLISPVAFSDLGKGNPEHSNALRMIKNVVAISITGAVILIICWICSQIQGTIISVSSVDRSTYASSIWQCVLISIVQMGMVHRATDLTKSALGMV